MRKIDVLGMRFGFLIVVGPGIKPCTWDCLCDCGNHCYPQSHHLLKAGQVRCKKCSVKLMQSCRRNLHGLSGSVERTAWRGIIARCTNLKTKNYNIYGGRGINVCERWRLSFLDFYRDMGPRPSNTHSIDRINNDGNYEPSNCRWATREQQNNNTRVNRILVFRGESLTLSQWSKRVGLKAHTVLCRLRRGWDVESSLTVSPIGNGRKVKNVRRIK